ncbi:lipoprotein [Herminiimonas sp. CN]|uniref:LPS translocon maturation chaperone LptM n=1 Tax=Herminiimonas sp. CN TaxID=1349818 RepID=UPI00055637CE|nr:lipoprotein [Herminiimonas sp. CN]
MNSFFSLPRCAAIAVFATLIGLLAACGQKGPLYLQTKPTSASAANPAATPTPAATGAPAGIPLPATK